MDKIHDLINKERRKRKLPHIYWSREMARFARSQARECADRGYMIHSDRYAFQGGECLVGGGGNISPRQAVNSWLRSKQGHREYILSSKVKKAGVGVARRNGKMFVAWAFSSSSCRYPDCPAYKPRFKMPKLFNLIRLEKEEVMKALIVVGIVWLLVLGLGGCQEVGNVEGLQSHTIQGEDFVLDVSVEAIGPVKYIYSGPIDNEPTDRIYTPFLNPENYVLFDLTIKLNKFIEKEKLFIPLVVKTKDKDIVVSDVVVLIWSRQELTSPIEPSSEERDIRVWERYEDAKQKFPPSRKITMAMSSYDISVALVIKSAWNEIMQNPGKYKVDSITAATRDGGTIYIENLDGIFKEFLYFDLVE